MAVLNRPTKSSSLVGTVKGISANQYRVMTGEYLLKAGQITRGQLEEATRWVRLNPDGFISSFLLKKFYIEPNTIPTILSRQYNFSVINLDETEIDPELIAKLPYKDAKKYMSIPYQIRDDKLILAMIEPTNNIFIEEIKTRFNMDVQVGVVSERSLIDAYKKFYHIDEKEYASFSDPLVLDKKMSKISEKVVSVDNIGDLISDALDDYIVDDVDDDIIIDDPTLSAESAPIVKLVNQILVQAVQGGVSDVHVEPFEKQFYVRYRLDGALYKSMKLPLEIRNAMIARFKVMASLDITERRVPQDGRIKMKFGRNREVDFRVSSLPTLFGESVVLRILDKSGLNVDMTKLGFTQKNLDQFMKAVYRPNGLVLVTGPTGSGKTVTLYSSLNLRNTDDVKILTAEDPVEFNFTGINQVNVIREAGMTFAKALKAFLRQDPDICMIGEIRDLETAEIAVEAAMTGHLVFSTLHTNDSPATVTRLIDMGVPSYNVAASLVLCSSQRLIRRICPKCKQPQSRVSANKLVEAGFDKEEMANIQLYEGRGCPNCNGTGYKGRLGLFEVLEVTPTMAEAVASSLPEAQLRKIAIKEGMSTLRLDGLLKAKQGMTTIDQVLEKTVIQKESLPHYLLNPDEMIFENGDIIIKEGNSDINFYRLIQGALNVYKGEDKIASISQSDTYFGEMSALIGGYRTATIKSLGRSIVKVFPGDKLMETIEGYPDISRNIIVNLVNRLEDGNKRLSEYIQSKTELERTYLAQLSAGISKGSGSHGQDNDMIVQQIEVQPQKQEEAIVKQASHKFTTEEMPLEFNNTALNNFNANQERQTIVPKVQVSTDKEQDLFEINEVLLEQPSLTQPKVVSSPSPIRRPITAKTLKPAEKTQFKPNITGPLARSLKEATLFRIN